MPADSTQLLRIEEVERGWVLIWYFIIGLALTLGTGAMLMHEVRTAQPGFLAMLNSLYNSLPALLFFLVGLAFLGGSIYTWIEKSRNHVWLDVETPVAPGGKLRARLGSDRALAGTSELHLAAELTCKRRETRDDKEGKSMQVETPVWSAQRNFPLLAGLASCEFEIEIPADVPPTDAGAASDFSAQPGIFWVLAVDLPGREVRLFRSYRIPVTAAAA